MKNLFGTIKSDKLKSKVSNTISTFRRAVEGLQEVANEADSEIKEKEEEIRVLEDEKLALESVKKEALAFSENIKSLITPKSE